MENLDKSVEKLQLPCGNDGESVGKKPWNDKNCEELRSQELEGFPDGVTSDLKRRQGAGCRASP